MKNERENQKVILLDYLGPLFFFCPQSLQRIVYYTCLFAPRL